PPFTVAHTALNPNAIKNPVAAKLGETSIITFLCYDLSLVDNSLEITLYWKSERAIPKDYSVFVHLLDASGAPFAQHDSAPQNGNAPTSWWLPGDLITDRHELNIPKIFAGRYTLALGVYDSMSGTRLPLFGANGARQSNDAWQLPIEMEGR
ncbi:MAG: hypothetical protein L0Y55_04890, partial [Anaerolineales bacterium]|nr:hypothetical protein [Anaerolineales bacterium]